MARDDLTREQLKLLEKCGEQYMIARLGASPFQVTDSGAIRIYLDVLCPDPVPVENNGYNDEQLAYVTFDNMKSNSYLPDHYDMYDDLDTKKEVLKDYYKNKLLIFRPTYLTSNNKKIKNAYIIELRKDSKDYDYFDIVPFIDMNPYEFEKLLKSGTYFDMRGYHGRINYEPELIICGNYLYRPRNPESDEQVFGYSLDNPERWKCLDANKVVKVHINDEDMNYIIDIQEDVCFVEDYYRNEVLFNQKYLELGEEDTKEKQIEDKIEQIEQEALDQIDESINIKSDEKELQFLNGLSALCQMNGLQYDFKDLINFHTSVKTNPLTILSGISGTGKTQLAYNYAKMLNLSEDNNTLLFMPVSPAYTEPNDVLGYYNVLDKEYIPADTGLVNFLMNAANNPDQLYMVIFDEMNLSQVEYWFSPFISILEKDPNERYLKLYNDNLYIENGKYPSKIKIGENIIFVGTANIDDTTKDFSDRLLDRAFMIELHKLSFKEYFAQQLEDKSKIKPTRLNLTLADFMRWVYNDNTNYIFNYDEDEIRFLDELDQLIIQYVPEGGISFRVLKNIGNYLANIPVNPDQQALLTGDEAIDLLLNQSVLTKIRGSENKLYELIGTINNNEVVNSKLIDLLNENSNISSFEKVRKTIKNKAKDLMFDGYTN